MLKRTKFSRYPLVESEGEKPIGFIHVKNIPFSDPLESIHSDRLRSIAMRCMELNEELPLEESLGIFQQSYDRLALVVNNGPGWSGILTFEDVVQEIIGNMGDEFDRSRGGDFVSLADALGQNRIDLGLQATTMDDAVQKFIASIHREDLPADPETIASTVLQRKQFMPIYVGNGLARVGRVQFLDPCC